MFELNLLIETISLKLYLLEKSIEVVSYEPSLYIEKIKSSELKLPKKSPWFIVFKRPIVLSIQTSLPPKVDSPTDFWKIFFIGCFDKIFPLEDRPFIKILLKSKSKLFFLVLDFESRLIQTISDSLLGFAVKYKTRLLGSPEVKSYSRFLIKEVTAF